MTHQRMCCCLTAFTTENVMKEKLNEEFDLKIQTLTFTSPVVTKTLKYTFN